MKTINLVTLALVIIGGINWLLIGIAQFDLVASIFGGADTVGARFVYMLVGVSAAYQIMPFFRAMKHGEVAVQHDR